MTALLEARKASRFFGGVKACQDVDLKVERGRITSLIGPNGAGKTTLFNVITGIFPPTTGQITFAPGEISHELEGLRPDEIAALGVARTFQNIRLFEELTVLENVKLGEHAPTEESRSLDRLLQVVERIHKRAPWLGWTLLVIAFAGAVLGTMMSAEPSLARILVRFLALTVIPTALGSFVVAVLAMLEGIREVLPLKSTHQEERNIEGAALAYLDFVGLLPQADELAKNLAYGDQRRLEIARALASNPSLLLLDEPAAGMNPQETVGLMELIGKIRDAGVTLLVIEHDMKMVMAISDYIYVLDHGELIAEGSPETVQKNPKVIEAYLGVAAEETA